MAAISDDKLEELAKGIAIAEHGNDRVNTGKIPNNNPGNIRDFKTGLFVNYPSLEAGWSALKKQASRFFSGSKIYNPEMTFSEVANKYVSTDDAPNWAKNVAKHLGVTPDTKLKDIMSQEAKQFVLPKVRPEDLKPILKTQIGPEIGPRAVQAFTNQGFHGTISPIAPQELFMDKIRNSFAGHLADKLTGLFGTPEELLSNIGTGPAALAGDVTSLFGKKSLFEMRGKMTDFGKIAMKYKDLLNEHFSGTLPDEIIGKLREHANVLSSLAPEELKQLGVSNELHGAASEYSDWLKKRENLKALGLPHPTLEYFAKKTTQDIPNNPPQLIGASNLSNYLNNYDASKHPENFLNTILDTLNNVKKANPHMADEIDNIISRAPKMKEKIVGKVLQFVKPEK